MIAYLNQWIQDQCVDFGTQRVDYLNKQNGIKKLHPIDDKKLFIPVIFLLTAFLLFYTKTDKHSSSDAIYEISNASFESTTSDIFFDKESKSIIDTESNGQEEQMKDTAYVEKKKVVTLEQKTLSGCSPKRSEDNTDISSSATEFNDNSAPKHETLSLSCNGESIPLIKRCETILEAPEDAFDIEETSQVEIAEIGIAPLPNSNDYTVSPATFSQQFHNNTVQNTHQSEGNIHNNKDNTKQDVSFENPQTLLLRETDFTSAITASEEDLQKTNKILEFQEPEYNADEQDKSNNVSSFTVPEQQEPKINLPIVNLLPNLRSRSSVGSLDSSNASEGTSKLSNLGSIKALSSSESPKVKELIEIFENIKEPESDIFKTCSAASGSRGSGSDAVGVLAIPAPGMTKELQPSSLSTSPRRNFNNNITLVSVSQPSSQGSAFSSDFDKTPTRTGNSKAFSSVGLMTSTSARPSVTTALNETPTKGAISIISHKL